MRQISGEIPSSYAKKDTEERELSQEEKDLLASQQEQLSQLTDIAQEQWDISKEDRATYEEVFRDADTPEAQEAFKDLQELMTGTRPTGDVTSDTLLRDVLVGSTGEMKTATEEFVVKQQADFDSYEGELSGLSKDYSDSISNINTEYQSELQSTKDNMGTIDNDILSREQGAATGGISSAYQELRKQQSADLARRGLAGSGAEVNALNQTYQAEARDKAGAIASSRMSALGLSDQRRMEQLGISGTQAQYGAQTAGSIYSSESGVASQLYGTQAGLNQEGYGLNVASYQQGISNLQSLNAASQGIYSGSQNYLGQAASSYGTAAQQYGTSAYQQGSLNNDYYATQTQANAASGAGIGSLTGTLLGTTGIF